MLEQLFQVAGILLRVAVLEGDLAPLIVLTGGGRVGSGVLAVDQNLFRSHREEG